MNSPYSLHIVPLTPMVKRLIIINVGAWFGLVLIFQQFFMDQEHVFLWLGLQPFNFINHFFLWQPFTYMFLHSQDLFHILFNMLLLWWIGSDLEMRWGGRFFLLYYMVCGLGAAIIYLIGINTYSWISGNQAPLYSPVVGASGAVFGLLLAYGIIFSERIIYLFFVFAMKAKYFVLLLGGIELMTLLSSGFNNDVANLAHLGGLISGFLFLSFWGRFKTRKFNLLTKLFTKKHRRGLKLVVNSDESKPKYWH